MRTELVPFFLKFCQVEYGGAYTLTLDRLQKNFKLFLKLYFRFTVNIVDHKLGYFIEGTDFYPTQLIRIEDKKL